MADIDWGRMMRPFYGRNLAVEGEKQRRKSLAGFNLPSTSMDALKAEQYVNTHTPPSKPSGQANLFYKPDGPTAFE